MNQESSPRITTDDLDLDGETLNDLDLSSGGKETFVLEVIVVLGCLHYRVTITVARLIHDLWGSMA